MSYDKVTMRAFRPSRFVEKEDWEEDLRHERLANLVIYVRRAQEGLPLFDAPEIKTQCKNKKV